MTNRENNQSKISVAALSDEKRLALDIALMVRQARVELGWSQSKLAEKANKKQASISRFENGYTLPSIKYLLDIATAMESYIFPPKIAFLEDVISYNKYYLANKINTVLCSGTVTTAVEGSEAKLNSFVTYSVN
jgi:transcriptional regulator with XRE-family HTH domain